MSAIRALERMLEAGVPLDAALDIARGFEADMADFASSLARELTRDHKADARKAKDAERKRVKRAATSEESAEIHGHPRTSADEPDAPHVGERAQVVTPTSSLRSEGTQEANASFVDASKPADPEKPKTKPPKASRGTRLPDDWQPSDADLEVARAEGLTDEEIHRAATEFRNYWCSRSRDATKLSWPKTWHNRVIEIGDRKRRNGPRLVAAAGQPGGHGRGAVSFADIYARRHGHAAD